LFFNFLFNALQTRLFLRIIFLIFCSQRDEKHQSRKLKIYWYSVQIIIRKYRTERGAIYSGITLDGQGLSANFCLFHGKNALGKSGIGTILAQRQNASPEVSERKSAAD